MSAHACSGVTRLPQPRLSTARNPTEREHAYDPAVPSDGLTLDTPRGPVDLVAVARALLGIPTPLTQADTAHIVSLLPATHGTAVDNAARGMQITSAAVQRSVVRLHAAQRATATDRPDTNRTQP